MENKASLELRSAHLFIIVEYNANKWTYEKKKA